MSRKLVAWLALVAALAAIAYSNRAFGETPRNALYHYDLVVGALISDAILLGIVLWIARGLDRRTLGVRAPVSWPRALGLILVVLIGLVIAEQALETVLHAAREQGLEPTRWQPDKALPFALNAALVVIAAPFVEELTFRGLGFALLLPYGSVVAVVGTAVAFAAGHGLLIGFPALFIFGVAIAFLRLRTQSIFPGMLVHACFNGAALAAAFIR